MELELFQSLAKYPFVSNGYFYDSIELHQNKTCSKCKEKECISCLADKTNQTEFVCPKDYDNILLRIGKIHVILNGLIFKTNRTIPVGRKEVKREWIVDRDDVLLFCKRILEIEKYLILRENETTLKNFAIFHDFKTSMNIFFTCTQTIIDNLPGNSFEEKLKGGNKSYQDLYHSLSLITSQLRMIDIFINPSSISYGNKKTINLYKLFEKMKFLFTYLALKKRDVSIKIINEEWVKDSLCYDSIEFIPLILLDNALKYSAPDSDIEIKIEQGYKIAKVSVKSIGPFVSDENKEKIFEKFFRDELAKSFAKEGLGMGLWIAQQILEAHDSKLYYYKDLKETRPIGLNIFEFNLPTLLTLS